MLAPPYRTTGPASAWRRHGQHCARRSGGPRLRQLRVGGRLRRRRLLPVMALRPCLQRNEEEARGHARGPKARHDPDHGSWSSGQEGRRDGKLPSGARRPSARPAAPARPKGRRACRRVRRTGLGADHRGRRHRPPTCGQVDRQAASPEMLAALERIGPRLAGWVRDHGELVHGHRAAPSVTGSPGNDVSYVRFPPSAVRARRTLPDVRAGEPLSARDFPRRWRRRTQPMAKRLAPTTVEGVAVLGSSAAPSPRRAELCSLSACCRIVRQSSSSRCSSRRLLR